MSFDVRVIDDEEEGVAGIRVVLGFTRVGGGMTDAEYTDDDGHAQFDGYDDGEVEVFLDGSNYGAYSYVDGRAITLSI